MADWSVLGGVVLGGLLTIGAGVATEIVRARQEWNLDKERRADDRRLAKAAFQRETLIRLQDALAEWARTNEEHLLADKRAFRASGVWGKNLVGEELSNRELAAARGLALLISRVEDDELRQRVDTCQGLAFEMLVTSKDQATAEAKDRQLAPEILWCLTRAGELARSLW